MKLRRWILLPAIGILFGLLAWRVSLQHTRAAAARRNAGYQVQLEFYRKALLSGTSRDQVEAYFRSKGIEISRICCIEADRADAELIRIGAEQGPWYCSREAVFVAFHFNSSRMGVVPAKPNGSLENVTIFRQLEDCL